METDQVKALKARIASLEAINSKLDEQESHWYILRDLAKPYTSLGLLNQAWIQLRNIGPPKMSTGALNTFTAILKLVNQAIDELIDLELARTLTLVQEAIYLTFTAPMDTLNLLTYLEQAAGKIVFNLAIEKLIWENNATIT